MVRAIFLWLMIWAGFAVAEPGTLCSTGRYGHVECIRPSFFAFDTCHMLQAEARRHALDPGFFTRLIWQESRFDPNAVSPAKAMGIAQFISSTADLRGLSDVFNPAEALEASAAYLGVLTERFGNPGLAAVAYNAGEARAARFIAGQSGLPRETVNYVQIITGLRAETWRDRPPAAHDFRLDPDKPFIAACLDLAKNRRLTALRPERPALKPWGAQLAFGRSIEAAKGSFRERTRRCAAVVKGETVDIVEVPHRSAQQRPYFMARIGRDVRSDADRLCARARRAGCPCAVYRN